MTHAPLNQRALAANTRPPVLAYTPQLRCPCCSSVHVRRIRRNWIERAITQLSKNYPHRCLECGSKFFRAIELS